MTCVFRLLYSKKEKKKKKLDQEVNSERSQFTLSKTGQNFDPRAL